MKAIDDVDWAGLEDAYGPAVETPHQIRRLISSDVDEARRALFELEGGIFHQGSYYSATAPAVPFVIDAVAQAAPSVKAEIVLLLAAMAGVHATPDLDFDPWVFRSSPGAPDYPEAAATLQALRAATAAYRPWISATEPTLRAAAAFLTSGIDPDVADTLGAQYAVEQEPAVRATLALALATLGRRPDGSVAQSALEAECLAAARASTSAHDDDHVLLEALAQRAEEPRTRFPFFAR